MQTLYIDLETYSTVPIKAGVHRYAESVEVLLFAWALNNNPVQVWDVTNFAEPPTELLDDIEACDEVVAHNAAFDRTVLRHAMPGIAQMLSPGGSAARWRDTMAKALSLSLPAALGDLCRVLNVGQDKAKDKDGRALVLMFCKPNAKGERKTSETHPFEWKKFTRYAGQDIVAMREIDRKLPDWNYRGAELELWRLDQKINDRGVAIDVDLARGAVAAAALEQSELADKARAMTDGGVESATQRDAMLAHILSTYGIELPDLRKATLERRVNDPELPAGLRELLAIRLQASATSTAKYKTLIDSVSGDGRLRGTLQFCGASRTGRWAGRLFQPQNISRGVLKKDQVETYVSAIKQGCLDLL